MKPEDVFKINPELKTGPENKRQQETSLQNAETQESSESVGTTQDNDSSAAAKTGMSQIPEVVDMTGSDGVEAPNTLDSSEIRAMDPADQLMHVQFSLDMAGFSPADGAEAFSVSTEEGESFNVTNGMDTNETEAAVANIL